MKRYLTILFLIGACVPPPPLGSATKKAFDAQAKAGQQPNGASQLSTEEVRAILGTGTATGTTKNININKNVNTQSKEPLNP